MSESNLTNIKEIVDETPADLFLAFKKRMGKRWQHRNELYIKKIKAKISEEDRLREITEKM